MDSQRLFVTCPYCGRRLCRVSPGSDIEAECPKCQTMIIAWVNTEKKIVTQIIKSIPEKVTVG